MSVIELKNVSKIYNGNVKAVDNFSLKIENGEFIVFVGPSGCGKSTTLRMIAGLEEITDGELLIDNNIANDLEPKDRDLAMVFQNYALYPYLNVYDNIAFGLKLRRFKKSEIKKRVEEVAKTLEIEEYLKRKPKALSGGQRQRVALGRAMVREANAYLLDEPLSNLDAQLRGTMRVEIIKLWEKLQKTFIYVTHDQVEAMTMGTRIVVMNKGIVQQIDTPIEIYDHPKNKFVAGFIGTPKMNFFTCSVSKNKLINCKLLDNVSFSFEDNGRFDKSYLNEEEKEVILGIRSEDIVFSKSGIKCVVNLIEMLGSETLVHLNFVGDDKSTFILKTSERVNFNLKDEVYINFKNEKIHLFDKETEMSLEIKGE